MSKLAAVIKEEVSRLGRKEAKAATLALKRRILALEKLAREQRQALKQLAQRLSSSSRAGADQGASADTDAAAGGRFTPRSIKALRKRLQLTQMQFAKLTGVTHVAVYLWESGKTSPRGGSRDALAKARQLGVREAKLAVDALAPKPVVARGPRRKKKKAARRARS